MVHPDTGTKLNSSHSVLHPLASGPLAMGKKKGRRKSWVDPDTGKNLDPSLSMVQPLASGLLPPGQVKMKVRVSEGTF